MELRIACRCSEAPMRFEAMGSCGGLRHRPCPRRTSCCRGTTEEFHKRPFACFALGGSNGFPPARVFRDIETGSHCPTGHSWRGSAPERCPCSPRAYCWPRLPRLPARGSSSRKRQFRKTRRPRQAIPKSSQSPLPFTAIDVGLPIHFALLGPSLELDARATHAYFAAFAVAAAQAAATPVASLSASVG